MTAEQSAAPAAFTPMYQDIGTMFQLGRPAEGRHYDVGVIGVLSDTSVSNRPGARFGPSAIRRASSMCGWCPPYGWKLDPLKALALCDCGDILPDYGRPHEAFGLIRSQVLSALGSMESLLVLGGDHYITYPVLSAYAAKHGSPLALVQFDAHTDTWSDEGPQRIDHGSMLSHAIAEGIVDPACSVQVGIRTVNDQTMGMNIIDAPQVHRIGAEATASEIRRIVGGRPFYISFDIDCLDPAYAPGTGTPVCGGLSTHQAMSILRLLAGERLIGMDIVEVAPAYDHAEITALAAATLALDMLALFAFSKASSN